MKRPEFALSVRQPFAEAILTGRKTVEYRITPTKRLNERFLIYASERPRSTGEFARLGVSLNAPRGVVVGTVEISHCTRRGQTWRWHLCNPMRLKRPIRPKRHPQPVWFRPFAGER